MIENYKGWDITLNWDNKDSLDLDSQNRISKNPLRILDSKNIQTKKVLENAPRLFDFLSEKSHNRYLDLKRQLEVLKIPYVENFNLVRGLDYYTHTAFEITSGALGSQATVCGGGRYDDLIKQMGGPNTPAIGFAIGLERLILLAGKELEIPRNTDIYIINQGLIAESLAMDLSRILSNYDLLVELDLSGASFSKQFKKANKLKSKSIIVIGDDEAVNGEFTIRLFDQSGNGNEEEVISFENDIKLENWIKNTVDEFGGFDSVINCSGILSKVPFLYKDGDEEDILNTLNINFLAIWHLCRISWDHLCTSGRGRIIVLVSMSG